MSQENLNHAAHYHQKSNHTKQLQLPGCSPYSEASSFNKPDEIHHISNWLINYYKVPQGRGLARRLRVTSFLDNYAAISTWVYQQKTALPKRFNTLKELRLGFERLVFS